MILTVAGRNTNKEYPYRLTHVTIFKLMPSCRKINQIPNGTQEANPYIRDDAVTIDWKSYALGWVQRKIVINLE